MFRNLLQYRTWLSIGVVVILAAAVIGTGVIIQKRGEHARTQQIATTEGSKSTSGKTNNAPTTKPDTSSEQKSSSSSSNGNTKGSTSSNSSSSAPADQGSVSTGSSTTTSSTSTTTGSTSTTTDQSSTSELPMTGPRGDAMSLVAVAALTFAGFSYLRSRRARTL